MPRYKTKKTSKTSRQLLTLVVTLAICLSALAFSSSKKAYAFAPGCYADLSGTASSFPCSGQDQNGKAVDPVHACYLVNPGPSYERVLCPTLSALPGNGCFANSSGGPSSAPCSQAQQDQNGEALDPANGCYIVSGSSPAYTYTHVSCDDLTTAVASSSTETGVVPTDACNPASPGSGTSSCAATDVVAQWINPALEFLSIGVGLLVTIIIVIGGIQYSISGGDPQATAAAKKRIINALIAAAAYFLIYALLKFVTPGGGGL